jgi:glutathione S-transferase
MLQYTLFFHSGSASMIPHWMLIELALAHGIEYDTEYVSFTGKDQKSDKYLALNPKGVVPTLIVQGQDGAKEIITESVATAMLLAARHPEAHLAPSDVRSFQYAKYLETMIFLANTVSPSMRNWFYAEKDSGCSDPKSIEAIKAMAMKRIVSAWDLLEKQLEGRTYLVENIVDGTPQPTAADYTFVILARWSRYFEAHALKWKNLKGLVDRMTARDGWKRLCEAERLQNREDPTWPDVPCVCEEIQEGRGH